MEIIQFNGEIKEYLRMCCQFALKPNLNLFESNMKVALIVNLILHGTLLGKKNSFGFNERLEGRSVAREEHEANEWYEEVIRSYCSCFAFWRISILVTPGKLTTAPGCFPAKAMATALPGEDASHPGWLTWRQHEIRWCKEARVLHWITDICITNCK